MGRRKLRVRWSEIDEGLISGPWYVKMRRIGGGMGGIAGAETAGCGTLRVWDWTEIL